MKENIGKNWFHFKYNVTRISHVFIHSRVFLSLNWLGPVVFGDSKSIESVYTPY